MKIDNLDHSASHNAPERKKVSFRKKEFNAEPDSLELSEQAKTLQDQKGKGVKAVRPEDTGANYWVKNKNIEQIRTNLDSGLYEKQEYKEKTADKLLHSDKFKDVAYNLDSLKEAKESKAKATKIEEIKQKIASGFYNRGEVLDEIAEKLIREFGFK